MKEKQRWKASSGLQLWVEFIIREHDQKGCGTLSIGIVPISKCSTSINNLELKPSFAMFNPKVSKIPFYPIKWDGWIWQGKWCQDFKWTWVILGLSCRFSSALLYHGQKGPRSFQSNCMNWFNCSLFMRDILGKLLVNYNRLLNSWQTVDLRGQRGLKNGPDTEFWLLGGNLSLVSSELKRV